MMWLAALVLVLSGAGLLLALVANPRDPYAEKPWPCSRCRRVYPTTTEFFTHRDEVAR